MFISDCCTDGLSILSNARKKTEKEKWKETKEKSEVHIFFGPKCNQNLLIIVVS